MSSLRNVEEDEAGRLRAFRMRFGRGWDAEATSEEEEGKDGKGEEAEESLMDLISGGRYVEEVKEKEGGEEDVEMVTVRKDGVLVKVPALSRGERRGKS